MNKQPNEEITYSGPKESHMQEIMSSWSWGVPPSQYIDVYTNPEAF